MKTLPSNGRRHALRAAAVVAAVACGLAAPWASAQEWPTRPITVVVPFPAGGGTDAFARPLTAVLTKQLGRQVIIDNKGGAGGTLGAGIAAKAAPDGYTFFMGAVHHTIAPSMYPKLDYDLKADFIPIALVSSVPQVIVVHPGKVPAGSLKELIAYAKANPGKLNYGSAGNGTSHHLAGELFKLQTSTFITHIPYRGAGPALQDLIAGQVDLMFDGLGSSSGHIKGGRIKAIAVATDKPAPGFPDLPTSTQGGLPSYQVSSWYALWAPKGTPPAVVERMTAEVTKAVNTPELKEMWTGLGSPTPTLTGKAFGDFVDAEIKRWAEVVKASGAKLQ